ncbi:MAG TPA: hypothetical protein VGU20_30910 [Stellaceae bacterium]|nr:hypothetical protein [Terriglobia bacterium]HEV2551761.1 hypothetical protein [Stellaceae bacterium]
MKQEPYWPGYANIAAVVQQLQRGWWRPLGYALSVSFDWTDSRQGFTFWNTVYEGLVLP